MGDQFWLIFDIIGQKVFKNWLGLPERHELFAGLGKISPGMRLTSAKIDAELGNFQFG